MVGFDPKLVFPILHSYAWIVAPVLGRDPVPSKVQSALCPPLSEIILQGLALTVNVAIGFGTFGTVVVVVEVVDVLVVGLVVGLVVVVVVVVGLVVVVVVGGVEVVVVALATGVGVEGVLLHAATTASPTATRNVDAARPPHGVSAIVTAPLKLTLRRFYCFTTATFTGPDTRAMQASRYGPGSTEQRSSSVDRSEPPIAFRYSPPLMTLTGSIPHTP